MRRRLVLSTIAVVMIVILVLLLPVLLIVRDAEGGELPADVLARLMVIAVAAIASAALLAGVQARQLARPLERLARSAARVGDGDFSAAAPPPSGISEIDDISRALRLSANRVDRMLESERGFTADATHQLRTGLTGIAMRLELLERDQDPEVAAEATAALTQTHELNLTLDDLLTVARTGIDEGTHRGRPDDARRPPGGRLAAPFRREAPPGGGDDRSCEPGERHAGPGRPGDRDPARQRAASRARHRRDPGTGRQRDDRGRGLRASARNARPRCSTVRRITRPRTAAACRSPDASRSRTAAASS